MLMRNYKAHADPCVGDLPRGARGYQLLYTVVRKNIPNQLRLAEYLGIDRSVMPYVIDDLVEAGLVERQPDPADRRARKVVATPLGIEKFQQLEAQMARAERAVLGALELGEQDQFRWLLSRVARQAGDQATRTGRPKSPEEP
jgi:DNA-binding MarR family transcriptional regulator